MKLAALGLAAAAACGSAATPATVGNGGGARPAAVLFLGAGDHRVIEAGCWDPAAGRIGDVLACAAPIAAVVDGAPVVRGSDGVRYKLTGRLSDECEASGPTMVLAIAPETPRPGTAELAIAVAPPEVDVDFRPLPPAFDVDRKPTSPALGAELRAAVAAVATADLAAADEPRTIAPDELEIVQSFELDLDGDRAIDRVISATAGMAGYANYRWSGVVLLPGGRAADARSLWHSDLELVWFRGSFDLDGDGARELVYSGEYYEGEGVGVARLVDGALAFFATYGCGA